MRTINIVAWCMALMSATVGVAGYGATASSQRAWAQGVADASGNLHVPDSYRTTYQSLGAWAVANDQGPGAKQLHVVYVSPGAIAEYHKGGHFPDGTVLVKEVFEAHTAPMTTGTVSSADTLKGWFVMVKDDKSRYPGNKLWGDGWGWSWFDAANTTKTTSTDYRSDCKACHVPAQVSDWVYVGGYPSLRK